MAYDMYYDDDSEEEYDFGDSSTSELPPKLEEPRVASVARTTQPSDLPEGERGCRPSPQQQQQLGRGRGTRSNRSQLNNAASSKRLKQGEEFRAAIGHGNVKEVERILEEGFDPSGQLSNGWTGLMCACDVASVELVRLLLSRGSSPNAHKDMMTALMVLCACRHKSEEGDMVECAKLLVAKGARVNSQDRYCMSALMYACQRGRDKLVSYLVSAGADVNKQDCRGWTPLCYAADAGSRGVVSVLLGVGSDPCVVSHMGDTPAMLAYAKEYESLGELLEEAAGKGKGASIGGDIACQGKELTKARLDERASTSPQTYGDLELFLLGLQLRELIGVFKTHNVSFAGLLSLTDQDLEKMGVVQVGTRNKLLEGIAGVHKKQWKMLPPDGLPKRAISCLEAAAVLANLATHVRYLQGTSSYLLAQVRSNPDLLDPSSEPQETRKLLDSLRETTEATDALYREMGTLESCVRKATTLPMPQQQCTSSSIIRALSPVAVATLAFVGLFLIRARPMDR